MFGGPDLTYNGPFSDAFVAKVNSLGTALDYAGYIGGSEMSPAPVLRWTEPVTPML